MKTIFLVLAGIFAAYEISKKNPQGLNEDDRKDLAFFKDLLSEGKELSMGKYPHIYEYEFKRDKLGNPRGLKYFSRFTTTKNVYRLLEKELPRLDFFMQDPDKIDEEWLNY